MSSISVPAASTSTDHAAVKFGPTAWLAASSIALAVTAAAATFAPGLARHHDHLYAWSGVAVSIADALVLAGVIALARSGALRPGPLRTVSFALAIAGSAGIVVAEVMLRVDDKVGNGMFSVVGPIQALGFIIGGIGIAFVGTWQGWHRVPLAALGLYVPLVLVPFVIVPAQVAGKEENLPPLAGYHIWSGLSDSPSYPRLGAHADD